MNKITIVSNEQIVDVDWQRLADLLEDCGLNHREINKLRLSFSRSQFRYLGYYDGKIVATARAISDLTSVSYLCDIAVDPAYQGRGWGRELMKYVMADLEPIGKVMIYSVIDKIDFYKKFNFYPLHTGMIYVDKNAVQAMTQSGYISSELNNNFS